jgi:hypothetical protein
MKNLKLWSQTSWNKGFNNRLAPNKIEDDESVLLRNLFPSGPQSELVSRSGFKHWDLFDGDSSNPIRGIFVYKAYAGTNGDSSNPFVTDGVLVAVDIGQSSYKWYAVLPEVDGVQYTLLPSGTINEEMRWTASGSAVTDETVYPGGHDQGFNSYLSTFPDLQSVVMAPLPASGFVNMTDTWVSDDGWFNPLAQDAQGQVWNWDTENNDSAWASELHDGTEEDNDVNGTNYWNRWPTLYENTSQWYLCDAWCSENVAANGIPIFTEVDAKLKFGFPVTVTNETILGHSPWTNPVADYPTVEWKTTLPAVNTYVSLRFDYDDTTAEGTFLNIYYKKPTETDWRVFNQKNGTQIPVGLVDQAGLQEADRWIGDGANTGFITVKQRVGFSPVDFKIEVIANPDTPNLGTVGGWFVGMYIGNTVVVS